MGNPVGIGGPYQIWKPAWAGENISVIVCSAWPNSHMASAVIFRAPDYIPVALSLEPPGDDQK